MLPLPAAGAGATGDTTMSSTQHQLIEQCAIRLRGIVEALDNIHDSTQHRSPHRWSTDLDDVHSSAESLLSLIKDQAPPSEDQLIAAGLSYPLAKEDAVQLWYAGFRSEVVTVLEAWEAIGHDIGMNPSKGELLDSLRNMAAICNAHGNDMPAQSAIDQRQVIADAITGALAFGAQASQPPAEDHWLRPFYDIGRAEGQRTQELAMLVRMLASSLKRHAPESNLVARATNYLAAKGLAGTPFRDAPASVEQAGGDERAAFERAFTVQEGIYFDDKRGEYRSMNLRAIEATDAQDLNLRLQGWQARAALAQPSQSQYEASFEEWLANELEGEDGQPVPAAVCDIALARRAFNHWPKLEHPAKVGGVRFSAGVSSRLVVEAAQRLYEFESTPEKEAERIERLQAFREQLDPLNLAPHAEAFNEAPADALRPEQAEAEQPEVVARVVHSNPVVLGQCGPLNANDELMTVAQHAASVARWAEMFNRVEQQRDAALARVAELKTMSHNYCALLMDANAKLAELEKQEPINLQHMAVAADGELRWMTGRKIDNCELYAMPDFGQAPKLYAAPVAQAQHSVPEGFRELLEMLVASDLRKIRYAGAWRREVHDRASSILALLAAAPGMEVPQAWLDVQAERRRQITAEGWTPEHDDLYCAAELPRAAAAYILNGANDEAPAIWPFSAKWWKPRDARSNYVRASALILAEIERLDRAAAAGKEVGHE